MGKGAGFGKVIILGEHFVVHGAPAIAGGISNTSQVEVKRSYKNTIVTKQKVVAATSIVSIENVLNSMGVKQKYEVHLGGDLPTYGGLGSSAAFCVGMVRAIADDQGTHPTNDQVNRHAYEGEKAFHGNPSGIDNTMATHGGVMEFRRGKTMEDSKFEPLEMHKPLDIAVSFSGRYSETAKMIERVRKYKEGDEAEFQQMMDEYLELEMEGRKCIEKGKLDVLGKLMNENQALLSELGLSDESNDKINQIAIDAGALGAKVTGGGGGGCCIALAKDSAHAMTMTEALKAKGFESFATSIVKR
jgi:mevalonate kinase